MDGAQARAAGLDPHAERKGRGAGGGGFASGTYLTSVVNHTVCDNICIAEGLEFRFESVSQFNPALRASATLTGVPTCGWPVNLTITPCFGAIWSGMHLASPYRVSGSGWVELRTWEADGFLNGDDPFFCAFVGPFPHPACTAYVTATFSPRVGYGFWSFPLCENVPWGCKFASVPDLAMTFQDRP